MSNNTMSNDTMLDDTIKKCGILLMTSALTCDLEELNTRHTLLSSKIKRLERKAKTNKSYEKKLEEAIEEIRWLQFKIEDLREQLCNIFKEHINADCKL